MTGLISIEAQHVVQGLAVAAAAFAVIMLALELVRIVYPPSPASLLNAGDPAVGRIELQLDLLFADPDHQSTRRLEVHVDLVSVDINSFRGAIVRRREGALPAGHGS